MTPKEKATELFNKYMFLGNAVNSIGFSKQCAFICLDEIINQFKGIYETLEVNGIITGKVEESENYKYWQEVKHELRIL
jgi:hypothetical protein